MVDEEYRYIAIDLKSFYASVECVERGLDPLVAHLVVADLERTEKTICLAVSPALKSYGISGRARLFEVVSKVKEINKHRKDTPLEYIVATPRMALYMEYSARIYEVYLKYIAPEDIHVYSVDEVFIDTKGYLNTYGMSAMELAKTMMKDVFDTTGITSTAGLGTNLYLAKIAMDIMAKHAEADENGFRIAALNEKSYREKMWGHKPITDFWRIGRGYAKRLAGIGLYTMGDVARCSVGSSNSYHNEDLLYEVFGINAQLLIDHAWGVEPVTIKDIKAYKPQNKGLCSGQVLQEAYPYDKARIVVWEMAQGLSLELLDKKLMCNQLVLTVGYDIENLIQEDKSKSYLGEIVKDYYGRSVPKPAHGTINLSEYSSAASVITKAVLELFDEIIDKNLTIRRFSLYANHILEEDKVPKEYKQLDIFAFTKNTKTNEDIKMEKESIMQDAMLSIKAKYGKNAILKGKNLEEGATAADRNRQIGGHRA